MRLAAPLVLGTKMPIEPEDPTVKPTRSSQALVEALVGFSMSNSQPWGPAPNFASGSRDVLGDHFHLSSPVRLLKRDLTG